MRRRMARACRPPRILLEYNNREEPRYAKEGRRAASFFLFPLISQPSVEQAQETQRDHDRRQPSARRECDQGTPHSFTGHEDLRFAAACVPRAALLPDAVRFCDDDTVHGDFLSLHQPALSGCYHHINVRMYIGENISTHKGNISPRRRFTASVPVCFARKIKKRPAGTGLSNHWHLRRPRPVDSQPASLMPVRDHTGVAKETQPSFGGWVSFLTRFYSLPPADTSRW